MGVETGGRGLRGLRVSGWGGRGGGRAGLWGCRCRDPHVAVPPLQQGFDRNMLGALSGANSLRNFTSRF